MHKQKQLYIIMHNFNKYILEAINRGIALALDDFNEEPSNVIVPQKDRIRNNNAIKKSIELENITVDLGLPSGTLWCKHNIGAKTQFEIGKYYAWGELRSKKMYDWDHYKHARAKYNIITKYCNDGNFSDPYMQPDNITHLLPEDDIAYNSKIFKDYKFNIPTKKQIEELIEFTEPDYVKIQNYDKNNKLQTIDGAILKSKINGNVIFLPAAGFYTSNTTSSEGNMGIYWSSDLSDDTFKSYALSFNTLLKAIKIVKTNRLYGFPIRPIINI